MNTQTAATSLAPRSVGGRTQEVLEKLQRGVLQLANTDHRRSWLTTQCHFHQYSFNKIGVVAPLRPTRPIAQAFEIEPGIVAGEGPAGVEGHAWAQLQRQLAEVGRPCPVGRESRLYVQLLVVTDQGVIHEVVEPEFPWVSRWGAPARTNVLRLADAERAAPSWLGRGFRRSARGRRLLRGARLLRGSCGAVSVNAADPDASARRVMLLLGPRPAVACQTHRAQFRDARNGGLAISARCLRCCGRLPPARLAAVVR